MTKASPPFDRSHSRTLGTALILGATLALPCLSPGQTLTQKFETFDTSASATSHGWLEINSRTGNATTAPFFGWANTNVAGDAAGAAGGLIGKISAPPNAYGDIFTTMGTFSLSNTLTMSGNFFIATNTVVNQDTRFGYFQYDTVNGALLNGNLNVLGFYFAEPKSTTHNGLRIGAAAPLNVESQAPFYVYSNTLYGWTWVYNPPPAGTNAKGSLTLTLLGNAWSDAASGNVTSNRYTYSFPAGSNPSTNTYNGFGIANPNESSKSTDKTTIFYDNLSYTAISNPPPPWPAPPTIPTTVFKVTDYGAVGDGVTDNTTAIQNTINTANTAGGGIVELPPGIFLSGPLVLKSLINLQLDAGAILRLLPFGTYPLTYSTNSSIITWAAQHFITGTNLHDIAITGSGAIDGQGLPWWPYYDTDNDRPYMFFLQACNRELFENITISNSPSYFFWITRNSANTTIRNLTIRAPSSDASPASHNTDAIDFAGTNTLIQNCNISVGDDNVAVQGGAYGILITNCTFGDGHGVSIGSYTASGGVSNMTVINCTFDETDNGIRLKSDNTRGGLVQDIKFSNLGMTNINHFPIIIYSYYKATGNPTWVTADAAAARTVDPIDNTPAWRNITISNITATVGRNGTAGLLWGRTELPITNVLLSKLNITAPLTMGVFNAYGVQLVDSTITVPAGVEKVSMFNADLTITNTASGSPIVTLDGVAGMNALTLSRASATVSDTNILAANPITINSSILTVSNNLTLLAGRALNFSLGTNTGKIVATGNLTLNGTLNITNGDGFGAGTFTLFTCAGTFSGNPTLGSVPPGYSCAIDTNTPKQVKLVVQSSPPPHPSFGNLNRTGDNLVMTGTGGPLNGTYYVLTSTNVALPLASWTRAMTNQFDVLGAFVFTNRYNPNAQQLFYLLQSQ